MPYFHGDEPRLPVWMRPTALVMGVVMYLGPLPVLFDDEVQAVPIVVPRVPIPFQPAIIQTSTACPR